MEAPSPRRLATASRRIFAGGAVAAALSVSLGLGLGAATANADVLDDLVKDYTLGTGAGQIPNLLKQVMILRAQGFQPKAEDLAAVKSATSYRPNQGPLIEALSMTIAHQRKVQSLMANMPAQPPMATGGGAGVTPPGPVSAPANVAPPVQAVTPGVGALPDQASN
jgi:hypothetical protein